MRMLKHKWSTIRVQFNFLDCPSCRAAINVDYTVPHLTEYLQKYQKLKAKIQEHSVKRLKREGLDKTGPVVTPGNPFFGKIDEYAMHQCTFYQCAGCRKAYFAGMLDCAEAMGAEQNLDPKSLLCKPCSVKKLGFGVSLCEQHGNAYIDWKC